MIVNSFWLLRPMPHGSNHMKDFLEKGIIAVGYPIGESFADMKYDDIRSKLDKFKWSKGLGNVNVLVNLMKKGDIVVVPDDNERDVYFAKITSNYVYESFLDEDKEGSGYPHQRKVEWLLDKEPLLRSELPDSIKGSLRYPGTIADLTKHSSIISEILGLEFSEKSETDSLKQEAEKVLMELMKSEYPELRLRAAEIVLSNK